jgi:hypothetical protein
MRIRSFRRALIGVATILVAVASTLHAGCLDAPDHFEPADAILGSFDQTDEYYSAVRKVLLEGLSDQPYFRVVLLPSFTSECTLTISAPAGADAAVETRCANRQIYSSKGFRSPGLEKHYVAIDVEVAERLHAILERMILETRSCARPDGRAGVDGTTYAFSVFIRNRGTLAGETWSPRNDTRAGRLVASVGLLFRLARASETEWPELREQLAKLVGELRTEVVGP